jgi:hypothetical protein
MKMFLTHGGRFRAKPQPGREVYSVFFSAFILKPSRSQSKTSSAWVAGQALVNCAIGDLQFTQLLYYGLPDLRWFATAWHLV